MKFTDIFIKRPVLATVISLLIFLLGLRAIYDLPLQQFPKLENTTITVNTSYPGASPDVMQGFITSIIEKSIASADGVDYMTGESTQGSSSITVHVKLNFNPNAAFTNVMAAVAQVQGQLPQAAEKPVLTKSSGSDIGLMYIGFSSTNMTPEQITDYVSRVVQPRLQTVSGVAKADILGGSTFAMRIWLNPQKMAALGISPSDVVTALRANNYQTAAGTTKGSYVTFNINALTDLHNPQEFKEMVIKAENGTLIRLQDIAKVELGAQSYDSSVIFNGKKAVFIGISPTSEANPLTVIKGVRAVLPEIEKSFPNGLSATIVYDASAYIKASIKEVIKTILEATLIVIIVIFLFLGSFRSVLIPVVTIPLSLIGVCTLMLALGYSINLLTLLAMVLAIGLVVDDAIVVVENIYRHIEKGTTPLQAALQGAREIAVPVIAMTITLAAVYAPIGFMGGLTGALFKEFAFTLACTVIISGVIALTLSPMMCSKTLNANISNQKLVHFIDNAFEKLKNFYAHRLHNLLDFRPAVLLFAATVLASCYFLYANTQQELAPTEDQSVLFLMAKSPQYANIDYAESYDKEYDKMFRSFPEMQDYFVINGSSNVNTIVAGDMLKPWGERKRSQQKILPLLQEKANKIAGLQVFAMSMPALPVGGDMIPIQFVITSTSSYELLYHISQKIADAATKSGLFMFASNSLKFDKPELTVAVERGKAAELGISMQDIGNALAVGLGGNYSNLFSMQGKSYQVIPQVSRQFRLNPEDISQIYVKTSSGQMVPLSTVVSLSAKAEPSALTEFQQQNSATIQGMMMPGKTMGDALTFLKEQANKMLPKGMGYDYAGQSRQYIQEGSALIFAFFFAIVVIYLVLAAQFESFSDPLIVLISVPMSICGALIPLNLGLATINIYTQIGLITLIGLISKHGILMVDFANKIQQTEGLNIRDAIEKAASIRLRPILMTTAAMILGVMPLVIAQGAGAASRFDIGLVIATGMLIGTLFTLFVVPTMYTYIAKKHEKIE